MVKPKVLNNYRRWLTGHWVLWWILILGLLIGIAIWLWPLLVFLSSGGDQAFYEQLPEAQEIDNDLEKIESSLKRYYQNKGSYPIALEELMPEYIDRVPINPITGLPYEYNSSGDRRLWYLCVSSKSTEKSCIGNYFLAGPFF